MKQVNNKQIPTLKVATLAAFGLGVVLGCSSCKSTGLLSRNDEDETFSLLDEPEKKKKRGSLFNRMKNNNSFIDEDVTTTRRERIAAQHRANFNTQESAEAPGQFPIAPTTPVSPIGPGSPNVDLDPDPNRTVIDARTRITPPPVVNNDNLKLPGDSPDIGSTPTPDPVEPVRPTGVDEDGYRLLQPKLPGAETIERPSE